MRASESVPSILESEATGKVAEIYADIRQVLGTSVVNLIWRNLAAIPGALEWTWSAAKPLYLGPAPGYAESLRRSIELPAAPSFSSDTLAAAGLSDDDVAKIRDILDSYHYTNALALVVLSALIMHFEPAHQETVSPLDAAPRPPGAKLPELPAMQSLKPEVARLIEELNSFGGHRQIIDRKHVSAPRLLADVLVSGAHDACALGDPRPTARIDPVNPGSGVVTWPRARSIPQAIYSSRHAPTGDCHLPPLCRPSYFTDDWNLFVDPHCYGWKP